MRKLSMRSNIRVFMPPSFTHKLVMLAAEVGAAKAALAHAPQFTPLDPHRLRPLREDLRQHLSLMHPKS